MAASASAAAITARSGAGGHKAAPPASHPAPHCHGDRTSITRCIGHPQAKRSAEVPWRQQLIEHCPAEGWPGTLGIQVPASCRLGGSLTLATPRQRSPGGRGGKLPGPQAAFASWATERQLQVWNRLLVSPGGRGKWFGPQAQQPASAGAEGESGRPALATLLDLTHPGPQT